MQQAKGLVINKDKSVNRKQAMDETLIKVGEETKNQANPHRHQVSKTSPNNAETPEYLKEVWSKTGECY